MVFDMTPFAFGHTLIALLGIATGFVVIAGLLRGSVLRGWTAAFLLTTVATSVTGFGFAADQILPSHIVGALSLVILALTIAALYAFGMRGPWRIVYVLGAVSALYLNVFVLVVQLFRKVPTLHALAPTESELPFAIAQSVVLIMFIAIGVAVLRTRSAHSLAAG